MDIKLIVTDIDGTLLNGKKELTSEIKKVFKNFSEDGGEIVLATGRAYLPAKDILNDLGLEGLIISYNGGRIVDSRTDEIIYHNPIKGELTKKIIEFSRKHKLHLNLYIGDNWYIEGTDQEKIEFYTNLIKVPPIIKNFDELEILDTTKALFFENPEILREAESELRELIGEDLYITYSSPYFLELLNKGVNKGSGVKMLLDILNISPSNTIAFGDELNDLEMLEYVKYGVAMENANPKLKDRIIHKTFSNNENGVAKFLEELVITREDKTDLECLMASTRSKRSFSGGAVPLKSLEKMVNVTRYSGSARNSQEVRYILVNNEELLNKIFQHVKWAAAIDWNPEISESPRGYIIVCSKKEPSLSEITLNFDMGLATGNILLKGKELGYDSCIIGAYNKMKVDELVEMPDNYKSHYLIAIGEGKECVRIVPGKEGNLNYYRVDGEHFVPKLTLDSLILKKVSQ